MTACRSSFFLAETRSSSPWTWARTPFGPSSLMIFEIFLALSCVMPSLRATLIRYSLPEAFGSPASRALSDTPRLTSLSLNTSRTALARSSLLARMSTAWLPDQEMDAPTPRKSNRVPISLAAWLSALSTSCRSSLDTMSKEDSCDATAPRLGDKRRPACRTRHVLWSAAQPYPAYRAVASSAILAMPPALRHTAGCPSGQRERSVKPSAQPTLVRTQHLPLPAKTARWLRKRAQRAVSFLSRRVSVRVTAGRCMAVCTYIWCTASGQN